MQGRIADAMVVTALVAISAYSYFSNDESRFRSNLEEYCKKNYGELKFSSSEVKLLFELNSKAKELNERCKKAVARRQCLNLLLDKEKVEASHCQFTANQGRPDYLKLKEFKELANFFVNLTPPAKSALMVACLIPINEYQNYKDFVLPQLNQLQQEFLPLGFNALNLYQLLHAEVKSDIIHHAFASRNREEIDVWFARSILELGADYLKQARTLCLLILKQELNILCEKEKHDVMYYYLKNRGKLDIQDEAVSKLVCK